VPGRLELLARAPLTYVDYAHTPEAIAAMLGALREEFPGRRLVCVFGCGGDRDPTKRAPMGRAALAADIAVLTTDNSRSESPRAIADQVIAGVEAEVVRHEEPAAPSAKRPAPGAAKTLHVQLDRAAAIVLARDLAGRDGIVVVAGKGHETNQEIQGRIVPWDDRSFVAGLGVQP
jgi:UDP-N-acetylmuramoyl-L-alanyl-D-glutamate--2,6-diaminopimelate ligase